jgi:hypothetical protein
MPAMQQSCIAIVSVGPPAVRQQAWQVGREGVTRAITITVTSPPRRSTLMRFFIYPNDLPRPDSAASVLPRASPYLRNSRLLKRWLGPGPVPAEVSTAPSLDVVSQDHLGGIHSAAAVL